MAVPLRIQAMGWFALYALLALAPLLLMLTTPVPAKGGFWWESGIALGFGALGLLLGQFLLTARLRQPTAPFGIDIIYYFHRYAASALVLLVLLHPLFLLADDPARWQRLLPADWALVSGWLALVVLILLILTSVWRRTLHLHYNHWRILHLLLALTAVALVATHLLAIAYYSAIPVLAFALGLLLLILVALIVTVRLIRPWRLVARPWQLVENRTERGESRTLVLKPVGHDGMQFTPGQFAWLSLGHSPFTMQEHPFSFSSAPAADGRVCFTIKALGDFTATLANYPAGTPACVDGPYGIFSCSHYPQAPGFVFIAGGIGVAPVISMLEGLLAANDKRQHVLFAAHSEFERIPRREDITALAAKLNLTSVPVLESPPAQWQGETGWISRDILQRHLPENRADYEYFICGPRPMIVNMEKYLRELGVPLRRIHSELFDMA